MTRAALSARWSQFIATQLKQFGFKRDGWTAYRASGGLLQYVGIKHKLKRPAPLYLVYACQHLLVTPHHHEYDWDSADSHRRYRASEKGHRDGWFSYGLPSLFDAHFQSAMELLLEEALPWLDLYPDIESLVRAAHARRLRRDD